MQSGDGHGGLVVSEAAIQRRIQAAIRNAGGKVYKLHGGQFGVAGAPDLIGALHGRPFAIEVKRPGGKPTALQEHELKAWAEQGFAVGIATNVDEALEIIRRTQ